MGLLSTITAAQAIYSLEDAARKLADSDCDLSDADLVTDALVGFGIKPWLMRLNDDGTMPGTLEIWIEAHNIRTLRTVANKRYPVDHKGW